MRTRLPQGDPPPTSRASRPPPAATVEIHVDGGRPAARDRRRPPRVRFSDLTVDGHPGSAAPRPLIRRAVADVRAGASLPAPAGASILGGPMQYVAEHFTSDEQDILRPYFTNVDGPVFALVNLPEVVKGALFARVLALGQEPAPTLPRRVRRHARHHRRPDDRRERRAQARRRALRPRASSSTATTPSRSSGECTSRASRRRTCSPRCSSGAG